MRNIRGFDILAIISTIGIICWIATDFFGGMIIFLLSYGLLIMPIIILYIISFIETLISLSKKGVAETKIKITFHTLVITSIVLLNLYHSEILKSKRILTATLKDDLYHYTLILRENGNCENEVSGVFGFTETFKGHYSLNGDTIIFQKVPYDNNFIPDTMLIDKKLNAVFLGRDKANDFVRTKKFLNYFEIE